MFDTHARVYACQCIGRLEELLQARTGSKLPHVSNVVLSLVQPCLQYVMENMNEFINLKSLQHETVEYYEMVQLFALIHYSHFMNWNFEITIRQWTEHGYTIPMLQRIHFLQQNMKIKLPCHWSWPSCRSTNLEFRM